uniref:Uncharacterized protein n=1 Tax=Oryza nivara TaxID=4536 RepID=A0A0E0HNN5_ORYNI
MPSSPSFFFVPPLSPSDFYKKRRWEGGRCRAEALAAVMDGGQSGGGVRAGAGVNGGGGGGGGGGIRRWGAAAQAMQTRSAWQGRRAVTQRRAGALRLRLCVSRGPKSPTPGHVHGLPSGRDWDHMQWL